MKSSLDPTYLPIILDTITQGMFSVSKSWRITTFNRAAEKITGFRAEEVMGRHCYEVFKADLCESDCPMRRAMKERRTVKDAVTSIHKRDGRVARIELAASALLGSDGSLVGGVETFTDLTPLVELRKQLDASFRLDDIIAKSRAMRNVVELIPLVAESEAQVLVTGPSGSGKELVARTIHNHSQRRDGPFVAVNCGALPDNLLESELFGYRKGAFTDARSDKPGRIDQAEGGTLFLDEVGELKPALQVKLLRFLQEKVFEPLGATKSSKADVRVVSATNSVLECMVAEGTFREDLFYRLNVVQVVLPSLAERKGDIPLLIGTFIDRFRNNTGKPIRSVSPEAMDALMSYPFPGNVRELENIIERAFIFTPGDSISLDALPAHVRAETQPSSASSSAPVPRPAPGVAEGSTLQDAEAVAIQNALALHEGNRSRAARELGIHRATLLRKMNRLGLR